MATSRISSVIKFRNVEWMPTRTLRGQAPSSECGLISEAAYRSFSERFNIRDRSGSQARNHVIAEGFSAYDGSRIVAFHILRSNFETGQQLLREGPHFRGNEAWIVPCWLEPHRRKTVVLRIRQG
jgi:hypothetical protein